MKYITAFSTWLENIGYDKHIQFAALNLIILCILIHYARWHMGSLFIFCHRKAAAVVRKTSKRLIALEELNAKYKFHELPERQTIPLDIKNRKSYDNLHFETVLVEHIKKNISEMEELVKHTDENGQMYIQYVKEFGNLPEETSREQKEAIAEAKHIPYRLYKSIEERIYGDKMQSPRTSWTMVFRAEYTSINKRVQLHKQHEFAYHDIKRYTTVVREGISSAAYQRSLMTDSLRYDVLKADGFRCRLCGRSAQMGAILHVDHIVPVSKGGRTERSNLRTLCDCCNLGKGAKYDPNGLN